MKEQIINFLKKNPNPNDEELHAWAEENGFDIHKVETMIYELATKFVNSIEKDKKVASNNVGIGVSPHATLNVEGSTESGSETMISIIAKLHDYAEILEEKHKRSDLAEILDKIASEIVAKYRYRIKRPRKGRGTVRTKRKFYYKQNRQKLRVKMRRYRMKHRTQLHRRRKLRHYHRFG